PRVEPDVRLARELIEDAAVHVIGRESDQRRVLEALREDPLRRDLERVVVLALPPRLAFVVRPVDVLAVLNSIAMTPRDLERVRTPEVFVERVLKRELSVVRLAVVEEVVARVHVREH